MSSDFFSNPQGEVPTGRGVTPTREELLKKEAEGKALRVADFLRRIKASFAREYGDVWLVGEVHVVKQSSLGHFYFDLKDNKDPKDSKDSNEEAMIPCVLFRRNVGLTKLRAGDRIEVRGRLEVYAPRGSMQLIVSNVRPAGAGDLYAQFLALKEKLQGEGLFDAARKRDLPRFVKTVGIVTSREAAALQDVLRVLRQHAPWVKVVLYPALVQGEGAPGTLIEALKRAETEKIVDVILLVRGGGSLSDLWAYNNESLSRCIADLTLPVISGVGHETDTTIADWVADWRAATPTAAANRVLEDWIGIFERIQDNQMRLTNAVTRDLERARQRMMLIRQFEFALKTYFERIRARFEAVQDMGRLVSNYIESLALRLDHSTTRFNNASQLVTRQGQSRIQYAQLRLKSAAPDFDAKRLALKGQEDRLQRSMHARLDALRLRLIKANAVVKELDSSRVLARGYAIVRHSLLGVVTSADDIGVGERVDIEMTRGVVQTEVLAVRREAKAKNEKRKGRR